MAWSKSTIERKEDFHRKLLRMLPAGVRMFGRRELRHDGTSLERGCLWREWWQEAIGELDEGTTVGTSRVPKIMQLWMEKYVIKRDWKGRPRSLVIVEDLIQHSGEVGVCGIGGESDCDELRLVPEEHVSWSNAYRRG